MDFDHAAALATFSGCDPKKRRFLLAVTRGSSSTVRQMPHDTLGKVSFFDCFVISYFRNGSAEFSSSCRLTPMTLNC